MKDIPGYEGLYAVTTEGKVWSYSKVWSGHEHSGMWLKPSNLGNGYPSVTLHKKVGEKLLNKTVGIHRLVALTYIDNPQNKPHVNHIDYDIKNSNVENLEWVTRSENTLHSAKIGRYSRMGSVNGRYKYSPETIHRVRVMLNSGIRSSIISRNTGIPPTTISAIKLNKMRTKG